ncbi:hypothetical protein ACNHE5_05545 [Pandoraea pnomenusa]|uniref:hypothetical protein n=1 Tax=Pandoraea pnomenusa TaxID=93220 RepID=UPI003CF6DFF2
MQQFDITVPANRPFVVNAPGRFIKYVSGSNGGGDPTLLVTPGLAGGQVLALVPGQAYRVAANQPVPSSWTVANKAGGATILGNIVVGDGDFMDATVAGTVSVIDDSINRANAGIAFIGRCYVAPVTGKVPVIQLWNPAASGKTVVVETISVSSATAGAVTIGGINVAQGAATGTVGSKLLSGAPGVATLIGASVTSMAGTNFGAVSIPSNQTFELPFRDPIVVPPGWGLYVTGGGATNVDMQAMFEWYEK